MSDTANTSTPPPGETHEERTHWTWHVSVRKSLLVVSWFAPLIIMGVGYALFAGLRLVVDWPWNAPANMWAGFTTQLIMMVVWLLYEFWYTSHRNAAVTDLQVDGAVDLAIWSVLLIIVGAMINAHALMWFMLVPILGQGIDTFQAFLMGINNAAEKPYLSPKGST